MPYIKHSQRKRYDKHLNQLVCELADEGGLNYCITKLCIGWLTINGMNYRNANAVMGVLSCAAKELYRRAVAPYENSKLAENGDVF
jgi:hypothetical protein